MDYSIKELQYKALVKENAWLDKEILQLKNKGVTVDLQPQIKALHAYNEMKDLAQAIVGYLANIEGVSVNELHARYNFPMD